MGSIRQVAGDNGGKYTLAFMDEDRNPVDESEATNVYITEVDKDGKTISTTWGSVKPSSSKDSTENKLDEDFDDFGVG